MDKPPVSLKLLISLFLLGILILFVSYVSSNLDDRTKVVFCDVGQGDAAYIRVENKIDIVIDAGPDKKVLNCLAKHMPFYDRQIELAFITHPQKDHYGGFTYILDSYFIQRIVTIPLPSKNRTWQELQEKIRRKNILVQNLYAGDSISFHQYQIKFLWPEVRFMLENKDKGLDPNLFTQVFLFTKGNFDILFTGDYEIDSKIKLDVDIEVIKIPHHGSKDGINGQFLSVSKPEVAVISSGKNNSYGHPHKSTLDLLKSSKIKILRTDEKGDIKFEM